MSFFRQSSESSSPSAILAEAGIHRPSVSFSEAFLDSSAARVRSEIPQEYQIKFDELRGGILAFCREHAIPTEALSNTEVFGAALSSRKISTESIKKVFPLFRALEYLIAHKEPFREEFTEPLEYAEHFYHLHEQYSDQVELFEQIGILQGEAITGIDGEIYPIPTLEQVAQRLYEQRETLETKHDQGFTKLLLVPFGMSLDTLMDILKRFLVSYQQVHPEFYPKSKELFQMVNYQGVDIGDSPKLIYYPGSFDSDHQGKTKKQILEEQSENFDSAPGWMIHLFQPLDIHDPHAHGFALIPRLTKGQIHGKKILRQELEEGRNPHDYLRQLLRSQHDQTSPYYREQGMTLEDWILAFIVHLTQTGQPLDNFRSGKDGRSYLMGAFSFSHDNTPLDNTVPVACWYENLQKVGLEACDPASGSWHGGIRTTVII